MCFCTQLQKLGVKFAVIPDVQVNLTMSEALILASTNTQYDKILFKNGYFCY